MEGAGRGEEDEKESDEMSQGNFWQTERRETRAGLNLGRRPSETPAHASEKECAG